jgi:hypothetical protein
VKNGEDGKDLEKGLELALLVVRTFEVVEVLEGNLLEDGVDGLRVEALADFLRWWEPSGNRSRTERGRLSHFSVSIGIFSSSLNFMGIMVEGDDGFVCYRRSVMQGRIDVLARDRWI